MGAQVWLTLARPGTVTGKRTDRFRVWGKCRREHTCANEKRQTPPVHTYKTIEIYFTPSVSKKCLLQCAEETVYKLNNTFLLRDSKYFCFDSLTVIMAGGVS